MASTIIAAIVDTHVGSSTAVSPPKFTIHSSHPQEEHVVEYNREQRWLYECWTHYWDYVKQRVGIRGKYRKNRLIVFHLGDMIDGNHHNSRQLIPEVEDQINAGIDLFKIPVNMSDETYVTYGTDAHTGGNGEYEIALCKELGNTVFHNQYFSLELDGITFDIGHHGRVGLRGWTSSAAGYAQEIALEYIKDEMAPPRYVLRGHNHVIDDSGQKVQYTRCISLPCWQLRTSYGHKVKSGRSHNDIGGLIFDTAQPEYVDFSFARFSAPQGERCYKHVS